MGAAAFRGQVPSFCLFLCPQATPRFLDIASPGSGSTWPQNGPRAPFFTAVRVDTTLSRRRCPKKPSRRQRPSCSTPASCPERGAFRMFQTAPDPTGLVPGDLFLPQCMYVCRLDPAHQAPGAGGQTQSCCTYIPAIHGKEPSFASPRRELTAWSATVGAAGILPPGPASCRLRMAAWGKHPGYLQDATDRRPAEQPRTATVICARRRQSCGVVRHGAVVNGLCNNRLSRQRGPISWPVCRTP